MRTDDLRSPSRYLRVLRLNDPERTAIKPGSDCGNRTTEGTGSQGASRVHGAPGLQWFQFSERSVFLNDKMNEAGPHAPTVGASAVLSYSLPAEISTELQLRTGGNGSLRVTLGVTPVWVGVLFVVLAGMVAALNLVLAIAFPVFLSRAVPPSVNATQQTSELWSSVVRFSAGRMIVALVWTGIAVLPLYRFRRWGRIPRKITATPSGLVESKMGWFAPRHRFWPADRVTTIVLKPMAGSLSKRTVANLQIYCRRWIPLNFRLSSTDSQLPTHIAERLAATVGCPLTIR